MDELKKELEDLKLELALMAEKVHQLESSVIYLHHGVGLPPALPE